MSALAAIRQRFFRWKYSRTVRRVLGSDPLQPGSLPFILLSMVHHRDVVSYLVALKSFARFANPRRVVVVCDPSINDTDRAILKNHVPHLELRSAIEFADSRIPSGGTWERLLAISRYAASDYVVQLDADTVTSHDIPEVIDSIMSCRGFVLGTVAENPLCSLALTRENALESIHPNAHIQALAEVAMDELGLPETRKYVRGCSGFTGFPSNVQMETDLLQFSALMMGKLGKEWNRWGTEQVTSNYLIANSRGASALPFPKYGTPNRATAETAFIHFIGWLRFVNNKYESTSLEAIRRL